MLLSVIHVRNYWLFGDNREWREGKGRAKLREGEKEEEDKEKGMRQIVCERRVGGKSEGVKSVIREGGKLGN